MDAREDESGWLFFAVEVAGPRPVTSARLSVVAGAETTHRNSRPIDVIVIVLMKCMLLGWMVRRGIILIKKRVERRLIDKTRVE